MQELRSREEELTRAALQQKSQEESLKRREQQLAEREINVLERELNILIFQLNKDKPNVKKRKGKFKRSRLKLKDGNRISLPSGEHTKILDLFHFNICGRKQLGGSLDVICLGMLCGNGGVYRGGYVPKITR